MLSVLLRGVSVTNRIVDGFEKDCLYKNEIVTLIIIIGFIFLFVIISFLIVFNIYRQLKNEIKSVAKNKIEGIDLSSILNRRNGYLQYCAIYELAHYFFMIGALGYNLISIVLVTLCSNVHNWFVPSISALGLFCTVLVVFINFMERAKSFREAYCKSDGAINEFISKYMAKSLSTEKLSEELWREIKSCEDIISNAQYRNLQ
jgi:predicted PurR-regulated permease PerM